MVKLFIFDLSMGSLQFAPDSKILIPTPKHLHVFFFFLLFFGEVRKRRLLLALAYFRRAWRDRDVRNSIFASTSTMVKLGGILQICFFNDSGFTRDSGLLYVTFG